MTSGHWLGSSLKEDEGLRGCCFPMKVCLGEVSEQRQELFEALFPFGGSFTKSFILSSALSLHHALHLCHVFLSLCQFLSFVSFLCCVHFFAFLFWNGFVSLMCLLQFSDVKNILSQHFAQPRIPKMMQKSFFLFAYHQQQSPMHGFIGLILYSNLLYRNSTR